MTTIAASIPERVMCSDSLWTDGDECGHTRKVWRVRGELLGLAGTLSQAREWLAAYRRRRSLDDVADDITVLRLSTAGIHTWTQLDGWLPVEGAFYAIGTGSKVARGAHAAGATCRRAVRIAVDIDAATGGTVRAYRL